MCNIWSWELYLGTGNDDDLHKHPIERSSDLSRLLKEHVKAINFTGVSVSCPT